MIEKYTYRSPGAHARPQTVAFLLVVALSAPNVWANDTSTELQRQLAWQVALKAIDFSPGIIDGVIGPKTQLATREFQRVRGLPQTGQLDTSTAKALKVDPKTVLESHRIESSHLNEIGPAPTSWLARSKLDRLGHRDLEEVLAEQFHCTRGLLRRLNPGVTINDLKVGDAITAPRIIKAAVPSRVPVIEINLSDKAIRVIDRHQKL
ncbi:MAG: peptidoglycan-binding protein, partial [Phycisphaeraceae bacterium]|nr:peptidoglycan-binding protein [Phycisphaeraceae bacterium]